MQPHVLRPDALRRHAPQPDELVQIGARDVQVLGRLGHRQQSGGLGGIRRRVTRGQGADHEQRLEIRDLHQQSARLARADVRLLARDEIGHRRKAVLNVDLYHQGQQEVTISRASEAASPASTPPANPASTTTH